MPIQDMSTKVPVKRSRENVPVFLIAHTDTDGHNVAQARVPAREQNQAVEWFHDDYPGRTILAVGREGAA